MKLLIQLNSSGRLVKKKMSIKDIKTLSMNPHFYAMILNSFFTGYGKPCEISIAFLVLPILMFE